MEQARLVSRSSSQVVPLLLALALGGCGARSSLGGLNPDLDRTSLDASGELDRQSGGDRGTVKDLADDFCSSGAKVSLNGTLRPVLEVGGDGNPQSACCNEVGLVYLRLPSQGSTRVFLQVTVLVYNFSVVVSPKTVDLAHLPKDWALLLEYFLCKDPHPGPGPCARAAGLVDSLDSLDKDTFKGSLQLAGSGKSRELTLCMTAGQGAKPHPYLQQVRLHSGKVPIPK